MRKIVYGRPDGGVSIVHPVISRDDPADMTEAQAEERAFAALPSDAVSPRFVDSVPADRTFRNAWKPDLTVDMPKAREIHKDVLRRERAPLLAALDVEFMRAVEADDKGKQTEIAVQKQALRDVTSDPAITAAATPEDLKAVRPAVLAELAK